MGAKLKGHISSFDARQFDMDIMFRLMGIPFSVMVSWSC